MQRAEAHRAQAPHTHRVLLVDDYDDTRESVALLLRQEGFDVSSAASGADALAALHGGLRPCVMLLDVRMSGMDGWQVVARLRATAELATTSVVLFSGECDAGEERARLLGIRDFLMKPSTPSAIVAAIDRNCACRFSDVGRSLEHDVSAR